MKSKKSCFNFTIFKKNISRTWFISLIYFLIMALQLPVCYWLSVTGSNDFDLKMGYDANYHLLQVISSQGTSVLVFLMVPIFMLVIFSYLYFKKDNYMMHSFPINRKTLFVTGCVTVLVELIVPSLLNGLILTGMAVSNHVPYVGAIWYMILSIVVAIVFFVGFMSFAMMLSGQIVTAGIFYLILNFAYFIIDLIFRILISALYFGMENYPGDIKVNFMTPIAYLVNEVGISLKLNWNESSDFITGLDVTYRGGLVMVGFVVAAVAFYVLGYLFYKYKKLETVSDFIAVRFIKPIFTVGISFFVAAVLSGLTLYLIKDSVQMSYNFAYVFIGIAMVIFGAILFFVTLMMMEKSFRVFKKKNVLLCVVYSVASVLVIFALRGDFFDIENKVPENDEIVWAGVNIGNTYVFENPEDIEEVLKTHRAILDNQKEIREMKYEKNINERAKYLELKYKLKDGSVMIRSYILSEEVDKYSDKYEKTIGTISSVVNNPVYIKEHVLGGFYDSSDVLDLTFNDAKLNEESGYYEMNPIQQDFASADEKVNVYNNIYAAILKDIDEGNLMITHMDDYDEDNDYFNDVNFTLRSKVGPIILDEDIFWGYDDADNMGTNEKYVNIVLNPGAKNTIKALIDNGTIPEDYQFVTYKTVREAENVD